MSFTRYAPQASDLRTGDLVWPRADHQLVFFRADNPQGLTWLKAQEEVVVAADAEKRSLIELFNSDLWVGHVAWIELRDDEPWVVDATPHRSGPAEPSRQGVATQTYREFLADSAHTQSHIWHGRFRGLKEAQSQALISAAKAYLGRPYGISPFGFELTDDFYCSKLIWHAIRDALGLELKKKWPSAPQPWFTPWDVMNQDSMELLYAPPGRKYIESM